MYVHKLEGKNDTHAKLPPPHSINQFPNQEQAHFFMANLLLQNLITNFFNYKTAKCSSLLIQGHTNCIANLSRMLLQLRIFVSNVSNLSAANKRSSFGFWLLELLTNVLDKPAREIASKYPSEGS